CPGRQFVHQLGDALGRRTELLFQDGTALAQLHLYGAHVFGRYFNDQLFDRLYGLAVLFVRYHLRTANFKFVAFAAHAFDQHAEVQLAAAADQETDTAFLYAQTYVSFQLLLQTFANLTRGGKFALRTLERAGVRPQIDLQR